MIIINVENNFVNFKIMIGWIWLLVGFYLGARIVKQKRSPSSTIAWVVILYFIPFFGLVLYNFIGHYSIRKRKHSTLEYISRNEVERRVTTSSCPWFEQHIRLLENISDFPISSYEKLNIIKKGFIAIKYILREIERAENFIYLEYYIFNPDNTGKIILSKLTEKALEGIEVKLLVDGIGSFKLLNKKNKRLLDKFILAGGRFSIFHPTKIDRIKPPVNLRNHRKMIIVDGVTCFTGGMNISDCQDEILNPSTAYRDTHIMLTGDAVNCFVHVFKQDWTYATKERWIYRKLKSKSSFSLIIPKSVYVIASGPDNPHYPIQQSIIHAIGMAKRRIILTTPYFIPTDAVYHSILNAALRGVSIEIIVPEKSDSYLVKMASKSYLSELTAAGATIYEYNGRMMHAKTLVVDDKYSMIGTANFDSRSLLINFEIAIVLFDRKTNSRLVEEFLTDKNYSTALKFTSKDSFLINFFSSCARILSPLL